MQPTPPPPRAPVPPPAPAPGPAAPATTAKKRSRLRSPKFWLLVVARLVAAYLAVGLALVVLTDDESRGPLHEADYPDMTAVDADSYTCGVRADGTVACWGDEEAVGPGP
ncbi:MAG TPA: hypothetical protein VIL48_08400 [Acidimicrobiales bacterium]